MPQPVIEQVTDALVATLSAATVSYPLDYSFSVGLAKPGGNKENDGTVIIDLLDSDYDSVNSTFCHDQWSQKYLVRVYSLTPSDPTTPSDTRLSRMAFDLVKAVMQSNDLGLGESVVLNSEVSSVLPFTDTDLSMDGRIILIEVTYRHQARDPYAA